MNDRVSHHLQLTLFRGNANSLRIYTTLRVEYTACSIDYSVFAGKVVLFVREQITTRQAGRHSLLPKWHGWIRLHLARVAPAAPVQGFVKHPGKILCCRVLSGVIVNERLAPVKQTSKRRHRG